MEALGSVASIIALIQVSSHIIVALQRYQPLVKDFPREISLLHDELKHLVSVLEIVSDLPSIPGSSKLTKLKILNDPGGPVERCRRELVRLDDGLEKFFGRSKGLTKVVFGARSWPFSKNQTVAGIKTIEETRNLFALAISATTHELHIQIEHDLKDIQESLKGLPLSGEQTLSQSSEKIISWLSTTDPSSNHIRACQNRQPLTGEWFLNSYVMSEWKEKPKSIIWLCGIPGIGKTILSGAIIEHMRQYCNAGSDRALAYYYLDFYDQAKRNASSLLSSLVAQVCTQLRNGLIPERLGRLFSRCSDRRERPSLGELEGQLVDLFTLFTNVYIVIDALDECDDMSELLSLIHTLSKNSSNIHLLLTSRVEAQIMSELCPILTLPPISIGSSAHDSDMRQYIRSRLENDPRLRRWPDAIKAEVEEHISAHAHGMFRWAALQLDALGKCITQRSLRRALHSLPRRLDESYWRILMGIDPDYIDVALAALKWLCCSSRPLSVAELAEAAVLDPKSTNPADPDLRFIDPYGIHEILGSLVSINSGSNQYHRPFSSLEADAGAEYISFAHFSIREFLQSGRLDHLYAGKFAISNDAANLFIAESCLVYILQHCESGNGPQTKDELETFPLMRYACQFWYSHARAVLHLEGEVLQDLILRLFVSDSAFYSWLRIHLPDDPKLGPFEAMDQFSAPLYYASFLGLAKIVKSLLANGADINEQTAEGLTPLHGAAWSGATDVVFLLLDSKANLESKNNFGETALSVAAAKGHRDVVQLLIGRGADTGARDSGQRTALHLASQEGHLGAVQLLVESFADGKDGKDDCGRTALHLAASAGHKDIVEYLLNMGADIGAEDFRACNVLHFTAGDEETSLDTGLGEKVSLMKDLIASKKLDIEKADNEGRTPLHYAALSGHKDMIELIAKEADVNRRDNSGCTALHLAIQNDHNAAQNLLNDLGADLDIENNAGYSAMNLAWSRKALNWAAYKRNSKVHIRQGRQAKCSVMKKVLDGETGPQEIFRKRFMYQIGERASHRIRKELFREHRILQKLDHPNLVSYLGYKEQKGEDPSYRIAFLYLEYCEGGDLHTAHCARIPSLSDSDSDGENETQSSHKTHGAIPLGEQEVWNIVYYIAAALAYLHHGLSVRKDQYIFERNWEPIIHRDVKPANVVLKMVDGLQVVKLCDLGIARPYIGHQTKGSDMGAGDYQPPELFSDPPEDWSIKGDIYSLGKTLLRLLKRFNLEECPSLGSLLSDCTKEEKALRPSSLDILETAQAHVADEVKKPLLPLHYVLGSGPGGYLLQCFMRISDLLDDTRLFGSEASKLQRKKIVDRLRLLCFDGAQDKFYTYSHLLESSLHILILLGEKDEFERVLKFKRVCGERWKKSLWTPLHVAAQEGKVEMVMLLTEFKTPRDSRDIHGRLAIDYARDGNYSEIIKILSEDLEVG